MVFRERAQTRSMVQTIEKKIWREIIERSVYKNK
jgi:hypothetical protein